jgi:hypothetical protein
MRFLAIFAMSCLFALAASAQGTPAPACAPGWPPCGADRVLSEDEIRAHLFKAGEVTQMQMKGGTSGRLFKLGFRAEGKLDMAVGNGTNFGRDWKLEGGKLCLRAYQNVWNGQFNCGDVEVKEGKVFWVEVLGDGSRNLIESVSFVRP